MSTLNVTNLAGRGGITPNLPDGAVISGIATIGAGGIDVTGIVTTTSGINITGGGANIVGVVTASTGINAASNLILNTGGSERLRIASAGQVGIAGTNYGTSGQVMTSQGNAAAPTWGDSGGMWIKMASVNVAAGVAATTYDVFTDFASHTDKKWWKLHYFHKSVDAGDDIGLQVKIGGVWKSEEYTYQETQMYSSTESSNLRQNENWCQIGGGLALNRGELIFFNNSAPNVYQVFDCQSIRIRNTWGQLNQPVYQERWTGGAVGVGGSGPIQGIRLAHQDATWGDLNFALFAGNGW